MYVYQYYNKKYYKSFYHINAAKLCGYEMIKIPVPPHLRDAVKKIFAGDINLRRELFEKNINAAKTPYIIRYVNFVNGPILRELKKIIKEMYDNFEYYKCWYGSISSEEVSWLKAEIKYAKFKFRYGYLYIYL